ncbi:MAG: hypothetical protein VW268_08110 [Rhodospirillaceae bacterium]
MSEPASVSHSLDAPFPVKQRFRRRFVPGLIGFVGVSLVILGLTARHAIEEIYLELAQKRDQTIARAVAEIAEHPW